MNLKNIQKVYCSGIGGIGVSSIAQWFLAHGAEVAGSDKVDSQILKYLEEQGIKIHYEQKKENITNDIDLFVYSSALPNDHPELRQARRLGIPAMHLFEIEGLLAQNYRTVAIAGTNGKSTVTAMLSLILEKAQVDPTVIIGTKTLEWKTNFREGKSDTLIVEACEHQEHFLEIKPDIAVITNIEADHLDYYKTEDNVVKAFQKFANQINQGGTLVVNADDPNIDTLQIPEGLHVLSFGQNEKASLKIEDIRTENGEQPCQFVTFTAQGGQYAFKLSIPGRMNVLNGMAAIAAAKTVGVPLEESIRHIEEFGGSWRRFEILKKNDSQIIVTDYAHHPTAIKATIEAARQFYPDRKIIAIFQPHLHSRLEMLFYDFVTCFDGTDKTYLLPVYKVEGRTDQQDNLTLVKKLGNEIKNRLGKDKVYVTENVPTPTDGNKTVWLYMSAGDLDDRIRQQLHLTAK